MLAAILAFAIAVVTALSDGTENVPGLADPGLPPQSAAERHSQAVEALLNAGRLETVPANDDGDDDGAIVHSSGAPEDVPAGEGEENRPEQPTVDASNAPEEIDLGNVPAQENENAGVPNTVGASEQADLPDQAGGESGAPGEASCEKSGGRAAGCG